MDRSIRWLLGGILCGGHLLLAAGLPFEPEIPAADRRLLQEAMAIGETNALAAAGLLAGDMGSRPVVAFTAGNFYFQAGDYDLARRAYEEAVAQLPHFRAAKLNLGRIYLLLEQPARTVTLYQEVVTEGYADAELYLLLGHALQMQDRPVSAETAFRNALLLDPQSVEALTGLTQVLFVQQRYPEALALTGEVLAGQPQNQDLWRIRANAFMVLDRHTEAIRTLETARRLGLADSAMLALLGDLWLHSGQTVDALDAYQAALVAGVPDGAERLLRAVEGFLSLDDTQGARALLETLDTRAWPMTERARKQRLEAQLHWQSGETGLAEQRLRSALALNPLDGRALLLLATIAESNGQIEDALLHCERASRLPEYAVDALVQQARLEVGRQRYARAIRLLEDAQTRRPQPHVARYLDQLRRMQE